MNTYQPIIVMSASLGNLSAADNDNRHHELLSYLRELEIPYHESVGKFNGVTEKGVIISGDWEVEARTIATFLDQMCILQVDANRQAYLSFLDGEQVELGRWEEVTSQVIGDSRAYTHDVETGRIFRAVRGGG